MGSLGNLRTTHFWRLIQRYGKVPIRWLKYVGPCPNPHNDARDGFSPNVNCPLCGGTGSLYIDGDFPKNSRTNQKMVFQDIMLMKRRPPDAVAGQVQVTYLDTEWPLAERDRLIFEGRKHHFSEILERGPDSIDRLRYKPVTAIQAVYSEAGPVAASAYKVPTNGLGIEWVNTGLVPEGANVTIRYTFQPSWALLPGSIRRRVEAVNGDEFATTARLVLWQNQPTDVQESEI